ncbi:SEC14-like protein 3 [Ornithodoros turicata]|uniref:SEC14-like protein 3 n=1 Tax=Ornithodoros turicata TaxID=34597 RepID=UPI0031398D54
MFLGTSIFRHTVMSGYVGDLSKEQELILQQFRHNVSDLDLPDSSDNYLLRWLRAREFNLIKSEHMIRQSIKWRQNNDVDHILQTHVPSEIVKKHFPGGFLECSPEGYPVWLIPIGNIDIKGFLQCVPQSELERHVTYLLEHADSLKKRNSIKFSKVVETKLCIFDFENFSLRQLYSLQVMDFLTSLLKMYEDNYPETLEIAYIINAPGFFPLFWKIIRPFLTERTASKVHIYGKDGWQEPLLKMLDPSGFPQHWGGSLVGPDDDPRCSDKIGPGGILPVSYMKNVRQVFQVEGATVCSIDRLATLEVPVEVDRIGSMLSWEFQTTKNDLAFGVNYLSPSGTVEIMAMHRVSCGIVPEHGQLKCQQAGTYVLRFDNSFSWFTGKTLAYIIQVKPPTET